MNIGHLPPVEKRWGLFLLLFALFLLVLLLGLLPARKPEKEHGGSVSSLAQGPLAPYMYLRNYVYNVFISI